MELTSPITTLLKCHSTQTTGTMMSREALRQVADKAGRHLQSMRQHPSITPLCLPLICITIRQARTHGVQRLLRSPTPTMAHRAFGTQTALAALTVILQTTAGRLMTCVTLPRTLIGGDSPTAGLAGVETSDVAARDMAGIKRTIAVSVVTWCCNLIRHLVLQLNTSGEYVPDIGARPCI